MKPNITHKKCKAAFGGGKSHVAFARASVVLESRERLTFRLSKKTQQKGATLFTALVFLIMLTLLGANVAQMSNLEERMSGNTRNRDLAFQAAEGALTYVEQNLAAGDNIRSKLPAPPNITTGGEVATGLLNIDVDLPNTVEYWNGFDWSNESIEADIVVNQVASKPRYVVERFPDVGTAPNIKEKYRVTARSEGGDSTTVVILQSIITYQP